MVASVALRMLSRSFLSSYSIICDLTRHIGRLTTRAKEMSLLPEGFFCRTTMVFFGFWDMVKE